MVSMSKQGQGLAVLIVSTLAFTVCFMVWMMFGVIGIPIKTTLGLNATEFGLLTATPVLTGSLIRVPLGMWTDKFGGRIVLFILMMLCVVPIFLISYATAYWHFLVLGLFVGMAGGSFSVGTPYVARWFSKERQGFAMGIYGAGNSGAAVNKFVAPALIVAFGWTAVPQVYAGSCWRRRSCSGLLSHSDPAHLVDSRITWREQLLALKDPKVWKLCQYYSIVFGGYVAMSLWMVQYYVGEFGLDITTAALLAACFSLPGGVLARRRRLVFRSLRRACGDLVGAVAELDLPVRAELPTDRFHHHDGQRPEIVSPGAERLLVYRAGVPVGHRLGLWQGLGIQVHLRRISRQYRRHFRRRRTGRRPRWIRAADHVRRDDGPDRHPFKCLHVDVWRGLGFADLDVPHRSARDSRPGCRHPRVVTRCTRHTS
jgi:MFS family permease